MFPLSIMDAVPPKPFQDPAAELPSVGRGGPRLDRMLQLAQDIGHAELLFPAGGGNQELLDVEPVAGLVHDSIHAGRLALASIALPPGAMTQGLARDSGGSWGRFRDGIRTRTTGLTKMACVEIPLICASGRPLPRDQEVRGEPEKKRTGRVVPG